MMRRLTLAIAIVAAALGAPQISRGETVLRFIPQADLRVLDPIWTSAYITRNHGYMVFDTLFGVDAMFQSQPEWSRDGKSAWISSPTPSPSLVSGCVYPRR
jgi:peptide/nickel transport system substrate-binding protein